METTTKKKNGCGLGCVVAFLACCLGIFVLVAAGVYVVSTLGEGALAEPGWLSASSQETGGADESPKMREVWSLGDENSEIKVARIMLNGPIMPGEQAWGGEGGGSASTALRAIQCATQDEDVRAILIEIDSPGGGITISDQIYHALDSFKASSEGRVIVALMGDICASGGYYVALAADRIVAHPTTLTGSIGVLMSSVNLKELAEKIGIRDVTIKSGVNKDLLNPLRELNPEQVALLQQVVDALYERFVGLVVDNRKLPVETVRTWADGRVFLAAEAKQAGFVDEIGYREAALKQVGELLETEDELHYIRYEEEASWMDLLRRPSLFGAAEIKQLLMKNDARLLYQWRMP
jgi:protease-4